MPLSKTDSVPTTYDEVPTSAETDSDQEQGDQRNSSVFDFLFHDSRRVGSFLAQFEAHGVLQQLKATESVARNSASKTGVTGGFSIATLGRAGASHDATTTDEERDAAEYTYDPLWKNARTLLNFLESGNMIHRDIWSAQIGQFVLAKGTLAILDLDMLKDIYKNDVFVDLIKSGIPLQDAQPSVVPPTNRRDRRKSGKTPERTAQNTQADFVVAMLSIIPHAVQLRLYGENYGVWTSPPAEYLVGRSSDLVLKHGSIIPGEWHMLGVLDAVPDGEDGVVPEVPEALAALIGGSPLGTVAAHVGPMARHMVGRPRSSHGMTPLLIFREVSG